MQGNLAYRQARARALLNGKVTHRQLRNDGLNHLTIPGIRSPIYVPTWCEENGMIDGMRVVNQYGNAIRDYIAGKIDYKRLYEVMSAKRVVYDNSDRSVQPVKPMPLSDKDRQRIEALERLAARPGTAGEGVAANAALRRIRERYYGQRKEDHMKT